MIPLVSICIPTFNHADLIEQMLDRLTGLDAFAREPVEIVISDNASSDRTQAVCWRFVAKHPDRCRYFRNASNILDANFGIALSRGRGQFLKLANDTLLFTESGLTEICETVRRHAEDSPVLFFTNLGTEPDVSICRSLDEFVGNVSFHMTWIGSFGIWKRDLDAMTDFARHADLQLTQVDAVLRLVAARREVVVNNTPFATSLPRSTIGGYNLARVFGRNYFSLLDEYAKNGDLSAYTLRREKYKMLRHHILPFYLSFSPKFRFPSSGYLRFLVRDYWTSPFYWCTVPAVVIFAVLKGVAAAIRKAAS